MYQIKVEEENQKITKIKPEDKSKEELVTIVYDLEYCITNLEEQNSSLKNETSILEEQVSILEEQVSIFKEKNEDNEKKVNEMALSLLTEKRVKEEYAARNQELLLEKGAMMERDKANAEIVEKEKRKRKEFQKKYEELLEKFKNQKVVDVPEASQMTRERKGKTTVVSIAELAQVTEQFINDGPEAAMMISRLHYLVNNVFRRTGESRDSILKVASLLSNFIQSKEIPTWNRVVEIIISSIDTNKRREMVWKEFEKLRTEGLKADGSNYEMYVLTWNKAKMYWESFTKDQRFRELLKGLDHATTIEVLRNKHGLSQQQFEESDEKLWFTWIKDAIRTISAALEIRQNRSEANNKVNRNYNSSHHHHNNNNSNSNTQQNNDNNSNSNSRVDHAGQVVQAIDLYQQVLQPKIPSSAPPSVAIQFPSFPSNLRLIGQVCSRKSSGRKRNVLYKLI
ncbi:hypothetical protein ACTA71_006062 [Dictyostelium dimigraforme]